MNFRWEDFTKEDLQLLNEEKNPDIYGCILIEYHNRKYIADIQWETIAAYDRRGISINVHLSNDEWNHCTWIDDIKSIVTATDYRRFQKRAEKAISELLKCED